MQPGEVGVRQMTNHRDYCWSCGYSQRGLPSDRCPECGNAPKPPKPEPPRFDIVVSRKGVLLLVVLLALLLAAALT